LIWVDFLRALGQLADPRFRRVMWIGLALSVALLVAMYALLLGVIQWVTPTALMLPFVGEVRGLGTLLSFASLLFMIGLSVFLMMPVASAFTGLFLEDVAQAVEDRHYPALPPATGVTFYEAVVDSINYFFLLITVNILALALYALAGPFAILTFWALNGYLLGREYFVMVAMRRLGRQGARDLRKKNWLSVWAAGTLMAAPLTVPFVNLFVPVLGAATFTHLFHRISRSG
jgi:CysZ protein